MPDCRKHSTATNDPRYIPRRPIREDRIHHACSEGPPNEIANNCKGFSCQSRVDIKALRSLNRVSSSGAAGPGVTVALAGSAAGTATAVAADADPGPGSAEPSSGGSGRRDRAEPGALSRVERDPAARARPERARAAVAPVRREWDHQHQKARQAIYSAAGTTCTGSPVAIGQWPARGTKLATEALGTSEKTTGRASIRVNSRAQLRRYA